MDWMGASLFVCGLAAGLVALSVVLCNERVADSLKEGFVHGYTYQNRLVIALLINHVTEERDKNQNIQSYTVQAEHIDYNETECGYKSFQIKFEGFQGTREFTSLPAYPLDSCKDRESVDEDLFRRRRTFNELGGPPLWEYNGSAQAKGATETRVQGRILIDNVG
ncbi:hypothetical protein GQ44DRAFT_791423 [Phaeosphaeriaceae sp. PMI808]|nr:hypothetical protein GQ44DRAFT_791423 [Phaeosphaeriaceae sp. PMI808]